MSDTKLTTKTSHCQRCETPLETGDLRCSICGDAAPIENQAERQKVVVQVLRCVGCGAAIAYDPKHQAACCSFCGEVVEVETIEDPMEQTESYLPFTVTPEQAHDALRQWLSSRGWFRPSDLSTSSKLAELKPLWWVAWIFDADATVSWTADSNEGAWRSSWAPHSGRNEIRFDNILVSASRGLTGEEAAAISPGMNLATECNAPRGATENATLEQFDLQRSQARRYVTGQINQLAASRVQANHIPGSRFRNVSIAVVLRRLITRRFSLPAYVLAYRYNQRLYRVVICGQDPNRIIGQSPTSFWKVLAVFIIVLLIVCCVAIVAANA